MSFRIFLVFALIFATGSRDVFAQASKRIVCYWNSTSSYRQHPGRFEIEYLQPALERCTHLIFSGASVSNYRVTIPDASISRQLFNMKWQRYPHLKILLGIGRANANLLDDFHSGYLRVLESAEARSKFRLSLMELLTQHHFDGIDLAWQFPIRRYKNKSNKFSLNELVHNLVDFLCHNDQCVETYRSGFTNLIEEMTEEMNIRGKSISITSLPHVNSNFFDIKKIAPIIDAVHVLAFDQWTPEMGPKMAYLTSILGLHTDQITEPVKMSSIARYIYQWKNAGMPKHKIILGIPTFGRSWKLAAGSNPQALGQIVPATGPGAPGQSTDIPGLMSYLEICEQLNELAASPLIKIITDVGENGNVAYRLKNKDFEGLWVAYESPESAKSKAQFAQHLDLGGFAICDLSLDDYRGDCHRRTYPILRGASKVFDSARF